ncbi:MAG: hypothetical protein M3131_00510, partial [Actinomycetota bacterium]|nr:hypothetical protein [Actinomycetota bacterium]
VRAVQAVGEVRGRRIALASVLALAAAPGIVPRAATGANQLGVAERRAVLEADLRDAVRASAGPLRRCGAYVLPADLGWLEGAVAWELDEPLDRVDTVRRSRRLPAALARWGPVLVFGRERYREPLMSRGSRRDAVLAYPISDTGKCMALLSPLRERPQLIGGAAQITLLGRSVHWRAWAIRRSPAPAASRRGDLARGGG